jgi:transcriptional regulator with XRE-family HTH domain
MRTNFVLSGALIEVVKKHRLAKKLSMYKLAKLSGLDKSALGKLEAGLRAPSVDTAHKIARALEIPLWRLIKEAEGEKKAS